MGTAAFRNNKHPPPPKMTPKGGFSESIFSTHRLQFSCCISTHSRYPYLKLRLSYQIVNKTLLNPPDLTPGAFESFLTLWCDEMLGVQLLCLPSDFGSAFADCIDEWSVSVRKKQTLNQVVLEIHSITISYYDKIFFHCEGQPQTSKNISCSWENTN